ncbi:MAG: DUF4298 domain-containing protein [Saccharofermentans sp.]|nr:DUF4298 domain-containing protein [Saccharofermentans sp.]
MKNKKAEERIVRMEELYDRVSKLLAELENDLSEFENIQSDIQILESYYTGKDWRNDLKLDEDGKLPQDLKRGVLSEDGIYDLLGKNKEMLERLNMKQKP